MTTYALIDLLEYLEMLERGINAEYQTWMNEQIYGGVNQ